MPKIVQKQQPLTPSKGKKNANKEPETNGTQVDSPVPRRAGSPSKSAKNITPQKNLEQKYPSLHQYSSRAVANDLATTPKSPAKSPVKASIKSTATSCERGPGSPSKKGAFGREPAESLPISGKVKKIYKLVRKTTGALGGNGSTGAIYGELTMHSMQKIINILMDECEMTSDSRFIDVGSGLGKPNFHAAQYPGVRISIGVELELIRYQMAINNLTNVLNEVSPEWDLNNEDQSEPADLPLNGGLNFLVGDIDDAASTDPFTHVYMYDLGFPPPLQQSIARKFNTSVHGEYLISYRPPHRVIDEYGYDVEFITQCPTSMHGSGESHTCYFYKRLSTPPPVSNDPAPGCSKIILPPRPATSDTKLTVVTADAFKSCLVAACGPLDKLQAAVAKELESFLESGRPKRDRRARTVVSV